MKQFGAEILSPDLFGGCSCDEEISTWEQNDSIREKILDCIGQLALGDGPVVGAVAHVTERFWVLTFLATSHGRVFSGVQYSILVFFEFEYFKATQGSSILTRQCIHALD